MAEVDQEQLARQVEEYGRLMQMAGVSAEETASRMAALSKSLGLPVAAANRTRVALDSVTSSSDKLAEAQGRMAAVNADMKKSFGHVIGGLQGAADALLSLAKGLLNADIKFTNFNEFLGKSGDAAAEFGKAFGPIGMIAGQVVKGMTGLAQMNMEFKQKYWEAGQELKKMGAAGNSTTQEMMALANQADLTAATMTYLTKPIKDLGNKITVIGDSAGAAQKEFAKLIAFSAKEREEMIQLGFTQEDLIKNTGDYIALQAASGRNLKAEGKSMEQLHKASLDYQKNLVDLAAITGDDIDTIKKKQQADLHNRQLMIDNIQKQNKIARLTEESKKAEAEGDHARAERLKQEAQSIGDEIEARNAAIGMMEDAPDDLKQGLIDYLSTGGITTEASKVLARMGMSEEDFRKLGDQIKSGNKEAARVASTELKDTYKQRAGEFIDRAGDSLKAGSDQLTDSMLGGMKTLDYITAKGRMSDADAYVAQRKASEEALIKRTDKVAEEFGVLQEASIAFRKQVEAFAAGFDPMSKGFWDLAKKVMLIGVAVGGALKLISWYVQKRIAQATIRDAIKEAGGFGGGGGAGGGVGDVVRGGGRGKGPEAGEGFGKGIKNVGEGLGKGLQGLSSGIAKSFEALSKSVGKSLEVVGKGAGKGLEGLGKGIGSGVGGLLSGLMKGLASGLTAMANPSVVIGAAMFSASIAIIGAGISAAAWMMGKTLPTLAEGINSFTEIDGDALAKTGKGIFFLGTGLAVFAAGGAAAGIGGIVSNLAEGVTKFFGGKTPIEKLEDFSKLNINYDKVKNNAEAFAAFGKAMASYKGGAEESLMSSLTGVYKSVLGGTTADVFKKFENFSSLNVDPLKVKKNTDAFVAFGNAMASYKGGASEGLIASFGNSLKKVFGGDMDSVMTRFANFAKLQVDPDRALKLSQAFYNYAMGYAIAGQKVQVATKAVASGAPAGAPAGAPTAAPVTAAPTKAPVTAALTAPAKAPVTAAPTAPAKAPVTAAPTAPAAPLGGRGAPATVSTTTAVTADSKKQETDKKPAAGTASEADLIAAGLKLKFGDVQAPDSKFNSSLYDKAKKIQSEISGFNYFSSFNDRYHQKNRPTSKHTSGDALDFTLAKAPTPKEGADILTKLKGMGFGFVQDEYNDAKGYTTAGHIHAQISAETGGLAMGPKSGYPATLHGSEMIVPLDPNSILADLGKKTKQQIDDVNKGTDNIIKTTVSDGYKEILGQNQTMIAVLSDKLDKVINHLADSNTTQTKILRHSMA